MPDVTGALVAGRAAAESRMTSRVSIYREDPDGPTTDGRGLEVAGYITVNSDIPLRLAISRGVGRSRAVSRGESTVEVALREAHLPASMTDLRDRDVLRITAGELAGHFFEVVEATSADQRTARRVPVLEIDQPGGIS